MTRPDLVPNLDRYDGIARLKEDGVILVSACPAFRILGGAI